MNLEQFHGSSGTVQKEERERKSPARLVKELARDPSRLALGLRVRDPWAGELLWLVHGSSKWLDGIPSSKMWPSWGAVAATSNRSEEPSSTSLPNQRLHGNLIIHWNIYHYYYFCLNTDLFLLADRNIWKTVKELPTMHENCNSCRWLEVKDGDERYWLVSASGKFISYDDVIDEPTAVAVWIVHANSQRGEYSQVFVLESMKRKITTAEMSHRIEKKK